MQQWAVSFGKEIAALSARYSGAKLLQKVSNHAQMHQPIHTRAFIKTGGYTSAAAAFFPDISFNACIALMEELMVVVVQI